MHHQVKMVHFLLSYD